MLSRARSEKLLAAVAVPETTLNDRLHVVEAQRIIAVLEDTAEKLNFLDSITPDVLQHRDELSKFIGDEIARTMSEQKTLESRYEQLIEQRASMKGMVNKTKYKEVQEEIQDVSRALRESTNNLVRSLKENPNVSGNLIKVQRDRTELHDLLIRCIQELHDRASYNTVTYKVDEENNSRLRLQQLRSREKSLRETVSKLEETLADEQSSYQRTISEQKQAIMRLKEQLQGVKGSTSIDARFVRRETLAHVSAIWREYKLKERVLENKLNDLENKLVTEGVVQEDTKEYLGRKQKSLIEEVAHWEAKYENDVGEMDAQIKKLTAKRTALLEKLSFVKTRREKELDDEMRQKMEADRTVLMRKEKEATEKRQNSASRVIQKMMRVYLKRKKELDAIKGEGKKGKSGGKGKGKGKK